MTTYDERRNEIKQEILRRIDDMDTFTESEMRSYFGKKDRSVVTDVLNRLYKSKKIDCKPSFGRYVFYKVKG